MAKKTEMNAQKSETLVPTSGYAALANNAVLSDISEELTGLTLHYARVKKASAASLDFELPGENGELEYIRELRGVIVFNHPANSFYAEAYTGGNNPPDCGSYNGVTGSTGEACKTCPMNVFGSGQGNSKACKQKRMAYFLLEGELFPLLFCIPTASLKAFTEYLTRLLSKGLRLNQVVTKITLKKTTSSSGIPYSQCVFMFERLLDKSEQAAIAPIIEQAKAYAAGLTVTQMGQITEDGSEAGAPVANDVTPLT
ncbi:MAG: hypothetical protein IJV40_06450 [Oscillospiraceae bacterium]|nr:hypothetical protein [Oscillospiraceae bacterium]